MLQALLHTNYLKLSLVPRPLVQTAYSYIKATPFAKAFERVWPVTTVDMVDLRPCLRKNERSWRLGIVIAECLSIKSMLLSLHLSVFVRHTCMSKLLHCSSSYITYSRCVNKYHRYVPFCSKMAILAGC